MRNSDEEDVLGIIQALNNRGGSLPRESADIRDLNSMLTSMQSSNLSPMMAPQPQQAAMSPNADLVSFAQQYMKGGQPDLNQLIQTLESSRQREKEGPKGVMEALAELASGAAAFKAKNPRAGLASMLYHGSAAAYEGRKARDKAEREREQFNKERLVSDILGLAKDQREFNTALAKDERNFGLSKQAMDLQSKQFERDLKSQDITDMLHQAQTQAALRDRSSGMSPFELFHQKEDLKERIKVNAENRKKATKDLEELRAGGQSAQDSLDTIKKLQGLSSHFYQGKAAPALQLGQAAAGLVGFDSSLPQAETFDKLSSGLALNLNEKLKGATSDKDMALLMNMVPNSKNAPKTNKNLLNSYEALYARKALKAKAAQQYKNKFGPDAFVENFESDWNDYVNAHPLLNQSDDGSVNVNKKNLNNWQDVLKRGALSAEQMKEMEDSGSQEPVSQQSYSEPSNNLKEAQANIDRILNNAAENGYDLEQVRNKLVQSMSKKVNPEELALLNFSNERLKTVPLE